MLELEKQATASRRRIPRSLFLKFINNPFIKGPGVLYAYNTCQKKYHYFLAGL